MNEIILSKNSVFHGYLPTISHVDHEEIIKWFGEKLKDFEFSEKENRFMDLEVPCSQHMQWVYEYFGDKYSISNPYCLVPLRFFALIHKKHETSQRRTYFIKNGTDPNKMPDYTLMYFLKAKEGNLYIDYDNHRNKHDHWKIPFKERKAIMWDSDLVHYLPPNMDDELRITMVGLFQRDAFKT